MHPDGDRTVHGGCGVRLVGRLLGRGKRTRKSEASPGGLDVRLVVEETPGQGCNSGGYLAAFRKSCAGR